MVSLILSLLMVLIATPVWATDRYIDMSATGCSSPTDNDYDPVARACGGGSELWYGSFADLHAAMVAGDNGYHMPGIYTASGYTQMVLGTSKSGTSSAYINYQSFVARQAIIRPSVADAHTTRHTIRSNQTPTTTSPGFICAIGYYKFEGFVFDGANGVTGVGLAALTGTCTTSDPHHFTFYNNEIKNYARHAILFNGPGHRLQYNSIHDLRSDCVPGNRFYGAYVARVTDFIMEHNEIYNTPGGYMQVYPGPNVSPIIRYNYFHDNAFCATADFGGVIGGNTTGAQYHNNISVNNGSASTAVNGSGLNITGVTGTPTDTLVRNNVFYGNQTYGIRVANTSSNPLRTIIENNISVGNGSTNISNVATATTTVQTTNKSTGSITDYVVSTSDFTLKSGSPCINFGTARSGFNHNGSAPDCGAFESIPNPAASITTNKITLIFPMSLNVPIQGLSTTGVTVACTGSACPGSPTVNSVSRVVGTDTHVEVAIAGITGNACEAANQTWTITYNSATGTWTDNANIGIAPGIHQKIFSFTSLAVTNQCTGVAASGYPAGYHIFYQFEDGSGTNVNDTSANNLDGTFTNTPTWGAGKTGGGMVVTAASTQYTAVPWGSGVNPYSTDLTIVAPVNIAVGTESNSHYIFGPSHGTNQRFYVCSHQGTWRISYQAVACGSTAASSLAVTSGWNHLIVRTNGTTHVATLYKDGIAGTGGASVTLTTYTLASNLTYGRVATLASSGGTYDDFLVYLSLEDPVAIYDAFQGEATPAAGTLAQAAAQAQGVYLDSTGAVISFGALNSAIETVTNGGVSLVFQVHCQNIADCDETGFKLVYAKDQTAATAASAGTLLAVPNVETSDGTWFWGDNPATGLNNGTTTTRLTGTCTVTNGATQLTADQVPSVDLPQDGCVMLRYIVKVGDVVGSYFEYRLLTQAGLPLEGGYAADARVTVVNPRASGVGF